MRQAVWTKATYEVLAEETAVLEGTHRDPEARMTRRAEALVELTLCIQSPDLISDLLCYGLPEERGHVGDHR